MATAPGERWQHGQEFLEAPFPRMPTSVANGVLALWKAKAIEDTEVLAAERFHRDYVLGVLGAQEPGMARLNGSADAHDAQLARSFAVTRHREIADLLGRRMTGWLIAFVVDDLTFVAMSERFWPGAKGRKEMRGGMVTMLTLLARLYRAMDRRKRAAGE